MNSYSDEQIQFSIYLRIQMKQTKLKRFFLPSHIFPVKPEIDGKKRKKKRDKKRVK